RLQALGPVPVEIEDGVRHPYALFTGFEVVNLDLSDRRLWRHPVHVENAAPKRASAQDALSRQAPGHERRAHEVAAPRLQR
ncbi:hypothetical protein, partial [Priestia megaterium]|uniref:hypothetical protein n=1 Tax=Priestia megaterium TaxID=1404 RepID=UPI0035B60DD5